MRHQHLTRSAALALTLAALAAPTAAAQDDLRSPDARDAARTSSLAGTTATSARDLRTPDARDAASGRGAFSAPEVTVIKVPQASPSPAGGIDWVDVGIGAGSLLGLILLGLASTIAVSHRRQGGRLVVGER
jgi:hypothetical protein